MVTKKTYMMETSSSIMCTKLKAIRLGCFSLVATLLFFTYTEARTVMRVSKTENMKHFKILEMAKSLNVLMDASNLQQQPPYTINSPLILPPYDSLPPSNSIPLTNDNNNSPPYCVYPPPPSTPQLSPSPTILGPIPSSSPPETLLSPPVSTSTPFTPPPPSPVAVTNPPNYEPSPPVSGDVPVVGPPDYVPSPTIGIEPSPPVFEPPVVYPPPTGPPPSSSGGTGGSRGPGVWCVAKPSVPDPIIQEAMNYACGSGADCDPIQPNGQCYAPNTLLAHASYAFNSFWQRTKAAGGTCSFGGTAILVTVDPSSQGCRFVNY